MPSSDYTPSVTEVAVHVSDRTFDSQGNELGTFTPATTPTDTQVAALIDEAVAEVSPSLPEDIPDSTGADPDLLRRAAKAVVAYYAAAMVELRFFGKDVARNNSPYPQLMELYNNNLKRLVRAIENIEGADTPGGESSDVADPWFDFPEDAGGMVGWGTRW